MNHLVGVLSPMLKGPLRKHRRIDISLLRVRQGMFVLLLLFKRSSHRLVVHHHYVVALVDIRNFYQGVKSIFDFGKVVIQALIEQRADLIWF